MDEERVKVEDHSTLSAIASRPVQATVTDGSSKRLTETVGRSSDAAWHEARLRGPDADPGCNMHRRPNHGVTPRSIGNTRS